MKYTCLKRSISIPLPNGEDITLEFDRDGESENWVLKTTTDELGIIEDAIRTSNLFKDAMWREIRFRGEEIRAEKAAELAFKNVKEIAGTMK